MLEGKVKKWRGIMKKKILALMLCVGILVANVNMAYAVLYWYGDGGYLMEYNLYAMQIGNEAGAGAYTTENQGRGAEVFASVAIFSYNGSTIKNSSSKTQSAYVSEAIPAKGGNRFVSRHVLKNENYQPIGQYCELKR